MTPEDIIRMAREAWGDTDPSVDSPAWYQNLERFAALVAVAEREACAVAGGAAVMAGEDYAGVVAAIRARGQG